MEDKVSLPFEFILEQITFGTSICFISQQISTALLTAVAEELWLLTSTEKIRSLLFLV